MDAQAGSKIFGGEDAGEEACEGDEVRDDIRPVAAEYGDAEEDDVAGHGTGEDVAVEEEDDGVEQATGDGQEHGIGECIRLCGWVEGRHGRWVRQSEGIVNAGWLLGLRMRRTG